MSQLASAGDELRSRDADHCFGVATDLRRRFPAEIASLERENPTSTLWVLSLVATHHSLIVCLTRIYYGYVENASGVLALGLACWFMSGTTYYALSTFVHENSHRLVSKKHTMLVTMVIELGLTSFGDSVVYEHLHRSHHHMMLNNAELDNECHAIVHPIHTRWVRFITNLVELLPLGSLLGRPLLHTVDDWAQGKMGQLSSMVFSIYKVIDEQGSTKKKYHPTPLPLPMQQTWYCALIISALVLATLCILWGPMATLLHLWVVSFYVSQYSFGYRGQDLAEHPQSVVGHQTTLSTYFWWENFWGFNTGFHYEHHCFPQIPYNNLPKLKALAPEIFDKVPCNEEHYIMLLAKWLWAGCDPSLYKPCDKFVDQKSVGAKKRTWQEDIDGEGGRGVGKKKGAKLK